ncbi:hypothetical protein RHCRD62_30445 [Rhodococcus sp. RD6.2]|nr:hypothetical protein RHCRD62_30445 [Rhodococcus sp. RD6.2]
MSTKRRLVSSRVTQTMLLTLKTRFRAVPRPSSRGGPVPPREPAVDEQDLPVDPPCGTREEGHCLPDVLGTAHPFEWDGRGEACDRAVVLAVQEQGCGRRSGRDGVHRDVPAPQFSGEGQRHRLHRSLAGRVRAVVRELRSGDRRGEIDDRSALPNGARRQLRHDEGAADVGAVHPVQFVEIQVHDRGEDHDPGGVDHDVESAERTLGGVEHRLHRGLVGYVTADCERMTSAVGHLLDQLVGPRLVPRVVDGNRETIHDEPFDNGPADPAGTSGHEGYPGARGHDRSLRWTHDSAGPREPAATAYGLRPTAGLWAASS